MPERCLRINGPVLIGGWFIIVIIVLGAVVVGMDCLFPISGLTFAAYDFVLTFEKLALQFCVRVLARHCPLPFFIYALQGLVGIVWCRKGVCCSLDICNTRRLLGKLKIICKSLF